ncbi:MAG: outer membrane beta-barrel protein [Polyangiales bacterium]
MRYERLGRGLAAALFVCACLPAAGAAQDYQLRAGRFQLGAGLGFTASPTTFALGFEGTYYFIDNFSITPRLAVGFDDGGTLLMLLADGRYHFDLNDYKLRALKPFIGLGLGATFAFPEGPADSDVAFTFGIPLGLDYYITDGFSLGTEMQFLIPIDLFDDNFIYHWQVLTARYLF